MRKAELTIGYMPSLYVSKGKCLRTLCCIVTNDHDALLLSIQHMVTERNVYNIKLIKRYFRPLLE